MKPKAVYLVFCVLGIVPPYLQFVPWVLAQRGVPLGLFLRELFSTRTGAFFGMDVLVSAMLLISLFGAKAKGSACGACGCRLRRRLLSACRWAFRRCFPICAKELWKPQEERPTPVIPSVAGRLFPPGWFPQ